MDMFFCSLAQTFLSRRKTGCTNDMDNRTDVQTNKASKPVRIRTRNENRPVATRLPMLLIRPNGAIVRNVQK
jgi:hypothetical protein